MELLCRRRCGLTRLQVDLFAANIGTTGYFAIDGIKGCGPDGRGVHHHDADVEYPSDCYLSLSENGDPAPRSSKNDNTL
jgi:hypothetical protein